MTCQTRNEGSVLIVDDTPTNLDVLVDYLTGSGFEVFVQLVIAAITPSPCLRLNCLPSSSTGAP